nr:M4 family metallopeptidase [Kibdelosporangium sp. MJ126-NF4]CEL22431.1 Aminopeptidase Y (Arg, Lys, Leu preference) [Kibdelosporangium sp. MJ126-NF4]CTQ89286.1 Aminopeptidase Y (Arg, Lys, Leu preference) (EC 3.4.11.15) [Kibdelosporangium sp. MJ126-NF4]
MKSLHPRRVGLAAFASLALVAALPTASAIASPAPQPVASPEGLAAAAADRAAATGLDTLKKGPAETFRRVSLTPGGAGLFYAAYERTYSGLRVVGGDAVVVADGKGAVRDTVAAATSTISVGTKAAFGPERASSVAVKQLSTVTSVSRPELVVLAGDSPKLAYEVVVAGSKGADPSNLHVFVDAATGDVAKTHDDVMHGTGNGNHNGNVTIDTTSSGGQFSMTDPNRPGVSCGNQQGTTFTGPDDAWGNGSGTNLETACVDALYGEQQETNMLRDWLGRNGINGTGRGFPSRVGLNQVNAFWNGQFANFGHNQANTKQATPMDVVAHEFGHGIFQFTPGGAGSGNENGGLNESTGDIFGALTEHFANNPNDPPDYEVGEEVDLVGRGPIRFMYDPSRVGDPNCYSSAIPNTEVHAAAGPQNHWFYLLAEGTSPGGGKPNSPTCNSTTLTGIGIQKAGQIFYNGLLRKTSGWNHAAARRATVAAASTMFGATECNATKAAWAAVSVPAAAGEATCSTQPPGNDFSIAVTPTTVSVEPGQSATVNVSTQITGGNAQTVNLTTSALPAGATATFNPASVQSGGSATLTISTSATTPTGTTQVTITGDGADIDHTVQLGLTVGSGNPPTCSDPAWDSAASYAPGDRVTHNSHLWDSTWYSVGAEPGAPQSWAVWKDAGAC